MCVVTFRLIGSTDTVCVFVLIFLNFSTLSCTLHRLRLRYAYVPLIIVFASGCYTCTSTRDTSSYRLPIIIIICLVPGCISGYLEFACFPFLYVTAFVSWYSSGDLTVAANLCMAYRYTTYMHFNGAGYAHIPLGYVY